MNVWQTIKAFFTHETPEQRERREFDEGWDEAGESFHKEPPRIYRQRSPVRVRAMFMYACTAHNAERVVWWLGKDHARIDGESLLVRTADEGWVCPGPNEWVVRRDYDGFIFVMSNADFEHKYAEGTS